MKTSLLLVNTSDASDLLVYPIGLDYLVSTLKQAGVEDITCLDLAMSSEPAEQVVERAVTQRSYDVIAFNLRNLCDQTTKRIQYVPLLATLVKAARTGLEKSQRTSAIVLGGAGASLAPTSILREVGADALVAGEGESALLTVLQRVDAGLPLESIMRGDVHLDGLKYQRGAWGYVKEYVARGAEGNLQTKRGCAFACDYCSYPVIEGTSVRMRSPDDVADEFLQLQRMGFRKVFIVDAIFNSPPRHAKKVLQALKKAETTLEWTGFFSPKYIDRELLELIRITNGGKPLKLTIESGSDAMLDSLNKGFTREDILRTTALCREVGMPFSFTVLLGGVGENAETVAESLSLIAQESPQYASISIGMYVYPKTPLAKRTVGRIWNQEDELMGQTVYPVDRAAIEKQVKDMLAGCAFPVYLH